MIRTSPLVKPLAAIVIVSLQILSFPVAADTGNATLAGVIRTAPDNAPLEGVRVYAGDPATGRIVPSEPTGDAGGFTLADLAPGTYELAVESGESLYVVGTPVRLAPGSVQTVQIKIDPKADAGASSASKPSVWNNAFTASMIVLAAAIVIGLLVENATDDEDDASPF